MGVAGHGRVGSAVVCPRCRRHRRGRDGQPVARNAQAHARARCCVAQQKRLSGVARVRQADLAQSDVGIRRNMLQNRVLGNTSASGSATDELLPSSHGPVVTQGGRGHGQPYRPVGQMGRVGESMMWSDGGPHTGPATRHTQTVPEEKRGCNCPY